MKFNGETTIAQIRKAPEFADVERHIMYFGKSSNEQLESMSFDVLRRAGWNITGAVNGLERLQSRIKEGKCIYKVYSEEEIGKNPELEDVSVIHFPNTSGSEADKKPFIIVCAGGAFGMVCNFTEGFPTAAWFNKLGYEVFCLTYRVCIERLFPRPMEDLANAIRFVLSNRGIFGVSSQYIVCGFSAGGILTGLWGTKAQGYAAYNLPKPKALFPVYPVTGYDIPETSPAIDMCCTTMVGHENTTEESRKYDVLRLMHPEFPPCYITCGRNDSLVNPENSEQLYAVLKKFGIPAVLDETDKAEHGFGDGTGTTAEGWIDRAAEFEEQL